MTGLVVAILTAALTLSGVGANSYLSKHAQVTSKTNQTLVDRDDADFCTLMCRAYASRFDNYNNLEQKECGEYGIEDPFGEGKTFTKCLDPVDLRNLNDEIRNGLERELCNRAVGCSLDSLRSYIIKAFADLKRVMDKGEGYWSNVNSCKQLESKQSLFGMCIGFAYDRFRPCEKYLNIYGKCEQILEDAVTKKNEL